MRPTKAGALALLSCVLLSGCANNRYLAPAATFRDSTTRTISTLGAFYNSRNSYELDLYLSGVAADPTLRVAGTDGSGQPTPLGKPVFSPDAIKARLKALALVGAYASRLCDLTNSSAPSDFSDAAAAIGKDAITLSNSFQSLKTSGDPTAGSYVQPVSTLVQIVGEMYLNHQRTRMVREAIQQGSKPVDTILSTIKSDMDNIFSLQLSTGGSEQLATLIRAYNRDHAQLSYEQRVARLAQVKAAADNAASATASAPAQLVAAMQAANDALMDSARKGEKDRDFASVNAALNTWSSQIQTLAAEIQPLVK